MLRRETINKMDKDELRAYLYQLQSYTKTVKDINSVRRATEDSLICLLRQREDLSALTQKENDKMNRLITFVGEMENKYSPACSSDVCEYNMKASEE